MIEITDNAYFNITLKIFLYLVFNYFLFMCIAETLLGIFLKMIIIAFAILNYSRVYETDLIV